ncbi:stanniocalcin-2-like isoform X2 [Oncorhynchus keta]|uniref:stanniocalcin-2-like isoform X2 n=1 Tax=Oncorhynchus keta TaxID=8018 RepID=UPI00227AE8EE|nr:stanniocalcin-2-like isoform X2 [Oncorhynchus keta]
MEMLLTFSLALFLIAFQQLLATDPNEFHEIPQDKHLNQPKRRLSLQNTAEIQHCLVNAGDVGCGMFECFNNNSCEIQGLHDICMTFLHNAGKFDSQGKSFIKDALKCMAHGLRHRFSCVSRKCLAVNEMVFQLQRECYVKHNLCSAVRENVNVMVEMIHFQDLFPKGPHVELVNILLGCGEEGRSTLPPAGQLSLPNIEQDQPRTDQLGDEGSLHPSESLSQNPLDDATEPGLAVPGQAPSTAVQG